MPLTAPPFHNAKILVLGDVMLDQYWQGPTQRISPEAPVPVVGVTQQECRPGGAANVALNIAVLGASVWLLGTLGRDEAGKKLKEQLESVGISCCLEQSTQAKSITKLRVLSQHQQLIRLDFEQTMPDLDHILLEKNLRSLIKEVDLVIYSDYAKGSIKSPRRLIEICKEHQKPVLVDPKGRDFNLYKGASILTPNLKEFEAVMGHCTCEEQLEDKGQALLKECRIGALLITRGEQGMTLVRPQQPTLHLPTKACEVFDVTGAGDTVIATLATALSAGSTLEEAIALANIAAGIVVAKVGAATVSPAEINLALPRTDKTTGILSTEQLYELSKKVRAQGKTMVFTNGCFDIIHAGHVGYLEEASKLGDYLIVAVNNDKTLTKIKGRGRPINSAERRMAVLAALTSVDWVVTFEEETPETMLAKLQPDILVKGGDYQLNEVVGAPIVHSYGGEVKVLKFFKDCSTTAIVEKIRRKHTRS